MLFSKLTFKSKTLKNNTLWNLIGSGAPMLLGIVIIPYLIKEIGVEAFGILTLIWALIGYFSLFDFGLGRALTQQVASNLILGTEKQLRTLIKTGLLLTLCTGIIGGIVLLACSYQLSYQWLNVSVKLRETTFYCLLIAALGIPLTTITSGLKGILEAYEDFKSVNLLRILLGIANFSFPALSVMIFGDKLDYIAISLVLSRLIVFIAHLFLVSKKITQYWQAEMGDRENIKKLLSFGAWMTMSNIISPLMVTADRFIISSVLGASLVAYYTVPFEMLIRVLIIPASLTTALFPRLISLSQTSLKESKDLYEKSLKFVSAIMFFVCCIISIASFWGLSLWLGQDFANNSWYIASILSVGILFNGIAQIPHASIQASGNVKVTALLHLIELILYIPLLFIFLKHFGLLGAAIVWVMRVFGDLLFLLLIARKQHQHYNL
jgi:O-antigen/teichoic acid export membrane protein